MPLPTASMSPPDVISARLRSTSENKLPTVSPTATKAGALAQWRRTGAGSQILSDLGLHRLRVLGSRRRQVGLAGFGLEIVDYVALPAR